MFESITTAIIWLFIIAMTLFATYALLFMFYNWIKSIKQHFNT